MFPRIPVLPVMQIRRIPLQLSLCLIHSVKVQIEEVQKVFRIMKESGVTFGNGTERTDCMRLHMKSKTKNRLIGAALTAAFLVGIGCLLYPTVSDRWNRAHQTTAIAQYRDLIRTVDRTEVQEQLTSAEAFNIEMNIAEDRLQYVRENWETYNTLLNEGGGVMGYIEIPQIQVSLPIYHGTDPNVLQIAAGHVEWSSLPVGGDETHSVISGHSGLPSARLFTDLEELQTGDLFSIHILGEVFYYEVDQITEKLPADTETLIPEKGKDFCTLVTCTPYGVNTHRLLVRGRRTSCESGFSDAIDTEGEELDFLAVSFVSGLLTALFLSLFQLTGRIIGKKNHCRNKIPAVQKR